MDNAPSGPASARTSPENLRVTFWGVQGTCPTFPTQTEIADYSSRLADSTAQKVLMDLAGRMERGELTPALLRKLATGETSAEFIARLGVPSLPTYGGQTTCVEVLTGDGATLLFDMGTGLRDFSRQAVSTDSRHAADSGSQRDRTIHVFASHEHLDHRNGLPFSSILFEREHPFTLHIHGTRQVLAALDLRFGMFSRKLNNAMHVDDPLDYRVFAATMTATEIRTSRNSVAPTLPFAAATRQAGQPITIGNTIVTPFEVYHGQAECLAYKIRHGDSTFVFCTDHELRHGDDATDPRQIRSLAAERRLIEQCRDVDLAYFDAQYFLSEYSGQTGIGGNSPIPRLDWGHSCIEDVLARVMECRIKRSLIGHHDPDRGWSARMEVDRQLRDWSAGKPCDVALARSGMAVIA